MNEASATELYCNTNMTTTCSHISGVNGSSYTSSVAASMSNTDGLLCPVPQQQQTGKLPHPPLSSSVLLPAHLQNSHGQHGPLNGFYHQAQNNGGFNNCTGANGLLNNMPNHPQNSNNANDGIYGAEIMPFRTDYNSENQQFPGAWFYEVAEDTTGEDEIDYQCLNQPNNQQERQLQQILLKQQDDGSIKKEDPRAAGFANNNVFNGNEGNDESNDDGTNDPNGTAIGKTVHQHTSNKDQQPQSLQKVRFLTDSVEVPSSEHVAEIVGRQGCKIKALRAKTNTYIKTPVRGEEPIFFVSGRDEDVMEAKHEIQMAAEHFTQIRASRRHSQTGYGVPGQITRYVRVPLRVVGLVVGPKGNTIKRIQQDTHTYIITPSREKEPVFEVTGLAENVEAARREIENHIFVRTGNMPITDAETSLTNYPNQQVLISHAQQQSYFTGGCLYGASATNYHHGGRHRFISGTTLQPQQHGYCSNGGLVASSHMTTALASHRFSGLGYYPSSNTNGTGFQTASNLLSGRQNTNSSLQHYQPSGYVQRGHQQQPQHFFGTHQYYDTASMAKNLLLEDRFYSQPNKPFQTHNNLGASLASQNSCSSLFNSLGHFQQNASGYLNSSNGSATDALQLTLQEQKVSSQSQPSQVSPQSNSSYFSANNANVAPTYYVQAQPVQTRTIGSLINSLDLNSTPLGDVDRSGNGSAGAIGQHRETAQQQREPLVQNNHPDLIGINWRVDPAPKPGTLVDGKENTAPWCFSSIAAAAIAATSPWPWSSVATNHTWPTVTTKHKGLNGVPDYLDMIGSSSVTSASSPSSTLFANSGSSGSGKEGNNTVSKISSLLLGSRGCNGGPILSTGSANSDNSNDEGIGGSPTNSLPKLVDQRFDNYCNVMSIWTQNDGCDAASAGTNFTLDSSNSAPNSQTMNEGDDGFIGITMKQPMTSLEV